MKQKLNNLSKLLKKKALDKYSNATEFLIRKLDIQKLAQDAQTTSVPNANGKLVDISTEHNLYKVIKEFCENLAHVSSTEPQHREGREVSRRAIENIVNIAKLFDDNFQYYKKWDENPNLLAPITLVNLIHKIGSTVYHRASHDIDYQSYIYSLETLGDHYYDFYVGEYLGGEYSLDEAASESDKWYDANPGYINPEAMAIIEQQDNERRSQQKAISGNEDITEHHESFNPTRPKVDTDDVTDVFVKTK